MLFINIHFDNYVVLYFQLFLVHLVQNEHNYSFTSASQFKQSIKLYEIKKML